MKVFTLLTFILMVGCGSIYVPPSPLSAPIESGNVALIIDVSDNPTHTHIGTTVFNNFAKTYDYSWDMNNEIHKTIKSVIEGQTNLNVVVIDASANEGLPILVSVKDKQWVYADNSENARAQMQSENIVALIRIKEEPSLVDSECGAYGCVDRYSRGQGIYSRTFLGISRYKAAPSYSILVETLQPPMVVTKLKSVRVLSDSLGLDLRGPAKPQSVSNITEAEFKHAKRLILRNIEDLSHELANVLNGKAVVSK